MNQDFKDLLRLFARHGVEYLVVGGYAVMHHAQPRYTKDLDLWIHPDVDNANRVSKALRDFGVPLIEVTQDDFAQQGLQFMIGVPPCAVDFLTTVEGLSFSEAWKARASGRLGAWPGAGLASCTGRRWAVGPPRRPHTSRSSP